jgi:hypothetical protein
MQIKTNDFTEYDLTDDEYAAGHLLTIAQKAVLQNRLATYAREKINIPFDPSKVLEYAQVEAELAGKLSLVRELLDACAEVEHQIAERARADAESSSNS